MIREKEFRGFDVSQSTVLVHRASCNTLYASSRRASRLSPDSGKEWQRSGQSSTTRARTIILFIASTVHVVVAPACWLRTMERRLVLFFEAILSSEVFNNNAIGR